MTLKPRKGDRIGIIGPVYITDTRPDFSPVFPLSYRPNNGQTLEFRLEDLQLTLATTIRGQPFFICR